MLWGGTAQGAGWTLRLLRPGLYIHTDQGDRLAAIVGHLAFAVFVLYLSALDDFEDLSLLNVPPPRTGGVRFRCCAKVHKLASKCLV